MEKNQSTTAAHDRSISVRCLYASLTGGCADVRDLIDGIDGIVAPGRALAIIRTLSRYAMARDWMEASPAETIPNRGADTSRDRYLDMKEVAKVYRATDFLGYPFAGFLKLLMLTGQRRTEVASMRWADIDLDAGTWVLSSEDTKSARAHLVPLAPQAVELLKATPQFGSYVRSSDGETHVKGYSKAKQKLDTLLASSGTELEEITRSSSDCASKMRSYHSLG